MNLLAVSQRPATDLVAIMRGRWTQENAFKHGKERWGINQLDGRQVEAYDPETVIPNPARRRLDRALKIAGTQEGAARSALARLAADDPARPKVQAELDDALAKQQELRSLRPSTPKRARLDETELAGKLVHHSLEYKCVIDTIRFACANAEADLASALAPHQPRGAEAKTSLANLLAAPSRAQVTGDAIFVRLDPAGNAREQAAYAAMLRSINRRRLTLPGDPARRPLRFSVAQNQ